MALNANSMQHVNQYIHEYDYQMTAKDIITALDLMPHPEGGYYKETYRSSLEITVHNNKRSVCTTIYYLLENDDKSHFHRIRSDEAWYFHQGHPVEIVAIIDGTVSRFLLGNDLVKGEQPQIIIPANAWFGARIKSSSGFGLVSCSVAPGFDFADFELAKRSALLRDFPGESYLIETFTRD